MFTGTFLQVWHPPAAIMKRRKPAPASPSSQQRGGASSAAGGASPSAAAGRAQVPRWGDAAAPAAAQEEPDTSKQAPSPPPPAAAMPPAAEAQQEEQPQRREIRLPPAPVRQRSGGSGDLRTGAMAPHAPAASGQRQAQRSQPGAQSGLTTPRARAPSSSHQLMDGKRAAGPGPSASVDGSHRWQAAGLQGATSPPPVSRASAPSSSARRSGVYVPPIGLSASQSQSHRSGATGSNPAASQPSGGGGGVASLVRGGSTSDGSPKSGAAGNILRCRSSAEARLHRQFQENEQIQAELAGSRCGSRHERLACRMAAARQAATTVPSAAVGAGGAALPAAPAAAARQSMPLAAPPSRELSNAGVTAAAAAQAGPPWTQELIKHMRRSKAAVKQQLLEAGTKMSRGKRAEQILQHMGSEVVTVKQVCPSPHHRADSCIGKRQTT